MLVVFTISNCSLQVNLYTGLRWQLLLNTHAKENFLPYNIHCSLKITALWITINTTEKKIQWERFVNNKLYILLARLRADCSFVGSYICITGLSSPAARFFFSFRVHMEDTQSSALSHALTVPVCTVLTQVWRCVTVVLPQKEGDAHKNIKINIIFILTVIELLKDSSLYCLLMYFYFPYKSLFFFFFFLNLTLLHRHNCLGI